MIKAMRNPSALFQAGFELTMEQRLFRLLCLIASAISLFVILPLDVIQKMSPWVSLAVFIFGLSTYFLFRAANRGHYRFKSFFTLLVLLLNVTWFLAGGTKGSVAYYFLLPIIYAVILFRARTCTSLVVLFVFDCLLLLGSDLRFPGLAIPFRNESTRMSDLIIGFTSSALACYFAVKVVIVSHDCERQRIAELNRKLEDALRVSELRAVELEKSLGEVRTLRGLLPICSYCKKIRNDAGLWTQIEVYMRNNIDVDFSHGICPDCFEKHLPEYSNAAR
jgi:hypothetical protein